MNIETHKPVLLAETIEALHIKSQANYIDATLGAAGHSIEIIKRGANVLGIETDPQMIEVAQKRLEAACPVPKENFRNSFRIVQGNFRDIDTIARENQFTKVEGIIFDFGISSFHLDEFKRGFSFKDANAPLDMRLDPKSQAVNAADLIMSLRDDQLQTLFEVVMDGREAKRVTKLITNYKAHSPISLVGDLLHALSPLPQKGSINPATKAFLALRIAVNSELDTIAVSLPKALKLLASGGVIAAISFHSGEDRIVKKFFKDQQESGVGETVGIYTPTPEEVNVNPRARSAKLRVFKKY